MKPAVLIRVTAGGKQICIKWYTRKELAQDLRIYRSQPTRYSVCKNENAIVVEFLPSMEERVIATFIKVYA